MKVNNPSLKLIWDDLEKIFLNYSRMNTRVANSLESLGCKIISRKNHVKISMIIDDRELILTFSSTPSDDMAGKQILRDIRKFYDGGK